uniref:O-acyltransferase WSD1 C-terminal domain-containing protein n=1 Tax=Leersia perrieri TaxID=77586 RepID=A0A0D9XYP0_9ORYZ
MNARGRLTKLPKGYYGNAILSPVVETTVNELCEGLYEHTIGLVQKAKQHMLEEENMQSMVDLMALLRERPPHPIDRLFISSDIKWIGQTELDFGWAKRIGGGLPAIGDQSSKIVSDHSMYKDDKGERMIVVSMLLPRTAMDIFKKDIAVYLNKTNSK